MDEEDSQQKPKTTLRESLQRYFLAGLLVFLPVAITLWFIGWVIDLLDSVLGGLPDATASQLLFAICHSQA